MHVQDLCVLTNKIDFMAPCSEKDSHLRYKTPACIVAVSPQRHWFLRRTGSRRWHCRHLGTEVSTENNWEQTQDGPGLESRASPCMALALFFLPLLCCWKTETQQRVEKVSLEMSSISIRVVLRLKKQETLLMSNVCDFLHSYEISMISLLFIFIVDESIFY